MIGHTAFTANGRNALTEILVPSQTKGDHYHDPYTVPGARSIMRRFNHDVIAMLDHMEANRQRYDDGKTMLAKSPLAKKIWIAGAMKTLGLIAEHSTANGACALTLTEKAIAQMENIKRFG